MPSTGTRRKNPELAARFTAEIESGVEKIREFPRGWQKTYKSRRRYLLSAFPYAMIYELKASVATIIAVVHTSRDPKSWHHRISN
jgi:plasmid stabilization system protein ParE